MSEPRKHHYVPVCYLKQWAKSDDRRLCEHKLIPGHGVRPRRTAPKGTGYQVDLYRIPGVPADIAQNFERRFMRLVDTDASRALEKIIAGHTDDWPSSLRSGWTRFILSLLFRNPEAVATIRSTILEDAADRDDCHRLRSARPGLRDEPGAALRQCYRRRVPADRTGSKADSAIKDGFSDRPAATMFWDQLSADQWEAARSTATMLGLQLFGIELNGSPYDYEAALRKAPLDHRGLLIVPTSPSFFRDRARLADFALQHRLLSMFVFREWADAGGLLC